MDAKHPTEEYMEQMRRDYDRVRLQWHETQFAVLEQMWLELARALAAQGALNAEALAQQLEQHAQRAPDDGPWFDGLLDAAQLLRRASSDPDSLVQ